jgi:hypothetical protein
VTGVLIVLELAGWALVFWLMLNWIGDLLEQWRRR